MGIIKRQSLKSSIVNYFGVVIGVIFFNFIFPNLVSAEHLGLINLLRNLTFVFATIPMLGFSQILLNYYSHWENDNIRSSYNGFAFLGMALFFTIFVGLFLVFKPQILNYYQQESPLFTPYFYALIPLVFIYSFNQYLEMYSVVNYRTAFPAFLREFLFRGLLIISFYLLVIHVFNLNELVIGLIASYAIPAVILLYYNYKFLSFNISHFKTYFKRKNNLKNEFGFGFWMLLSNVFSTIYNFLDGIILPAYLGLEALGIYTPALVLGQMIQVPYRAISSISIPVIREALKQNDVNMVKELNNSFGINLFLIGSFLFVLLISNTDGIFSLIPEKYSAAKNVLYIIAIGKLIDMAFGLNSEILSYSMHYKLFVKLVAITLLSTIILNLILIPKLGLEGTALSITISIIIFNLLKSYFIYHKFHFHCFSKHYLTLLAISALVVGILYLVPFIQFIQHHRFMNSLLNIGFKSGLASLLFLIPVYLFKISPDFNDFMKLVLSGKILKGGHKMENL